MHVLQSEKETAITALNVNLNLDHDKIKKSINYNKFPIKTTYISAAYVT
jgi:hypothetical protein